VHPRRRELDVHGPAIACSWTHRRHEFIWCAPAYRRYHIPNGDVQVGHGSVHPVQSARDLGVYVDDGMTMRTHINHVLLSCYCALRQIRSIMPSLPSHVLNTRHCSGSQPVRLLQCCLRWSSSLWYPEITVSPQRSRTSSRRLIATRSCDFFATWPPLAASQTARRVQAVYDGTSLLVWWRTILPGRPDHAVGHCNCQTWSQICRIQFSCSATNYIVARRPVLRGCQPTCMEQTSTTASSRLFSCYF